MKVITTAPVCDKHEQSVAHWRFIRVRFDKIEKRVDREELEFCNHCAGLHWMKLTASGFLPVPCHDEAREPIGSAWR